MNTTSSINENSQKHKLDVCVIMTPVSCSISTNWRGKVNLATDRLGQQAHAKEFIAKTLPIEKIIEHILAGHRVAPGTFTNDYRRADHWQGAQLVALDYDLNSVADLRAAPIAGPYAFLIHSTASSGQTTENNPDGNLRSRAWFLMPERITDPEVYELLAAGLYRLIGLPGDEQTVSAAQGFYGSTNRAEAPYTHLEAVLPQEIVNQAIAAQRRQLEAEHDRQAIFKYTDDPDHSGLTDLIISRARQRGYKGSGAFVNGPCLFPENHKRGDRNASAGIAVESGVHHCFVCGTHSSLETAERLGIDTTDYRRQLAQAIGQGQERALSAGLIDNGPAALPPVETPQAVPAIESDTPTYTPSYEAETTAAPRPWGTWADGISDYQVLLAQATGVKNLGGLLLILALAGNTGEPFDLYQIAAAGLLEYDQLYRLARAPLFARIFEETDQYFANFYTIEKDPYCKNSQNIRRPRRTYRLLADPATVEAELYTAAVDTAFKLAAQRSGKRLPPALKERFAQFLPGVDASNVRTVVSQYSAACDALAKIDREFADDYSAFQARFGDMTDYLDRIGSANDPACEIQHVSDYADLLGKDADYHLKLAAYALRFDQKRVPDRPRTTTLDAFAAGVSVPLVTRKRATSGKYGARELAELRYADDTRIQVNIGQHTPESLPDAISKAARAEHGYALYAQPVGGPPIPLKPQNYEQICARAAVNGGGISLMMSVSQPMERYTPSEADAQPARRLPRKPRQTTDRQATRRKSPDLPTLIQDGFTRLLTGHGWTHEADTWADPTGRQYADDAPLLLAALTRQLEEKKMSSIHHQADTYDREPVQLLVTADQPEPEPTTTAPIAIWADRPAFYELIRPNIFSTRSEMRVTA